MSWHDDIAFEVEAEFLRFMPHWDMCENAVWFARLVKNAQWAECGRHWKRTAVGRQQSRDGAKRLYVLLSAVPDGWVKCKACGVQFDVNAMQRRKGRSVCSLKCAAVLRHRADHESSRPTRTPSEKARRNRLAKARYHRTTPDGQAVCLACGNPFAVSVERRRKGNTKACSYACAGRLSSQAREANKAVERSNGASA